MSLTVKASPRAHSRSWLLALVSLLGAGACSGPRGATPLPEPPALDPARIGIPELVTVAFPSIPLSGSKGAAPANAVVRVTNLDSMGDPVATSADGNGAFTIVVGGVPGNELRLQALLDGERSPPVDLVYSGGSPATLTASPRHACVALTPGFELSFDAAGTQSLELASSCAGSLTVSNPRLRRGSAAFTLSTPLPLDVAPSSEAMLNVESSATPGSGEEDALFLDLDVAGDVLRYPVTLVAP
jgi:hypothetical protein